MERPVLLDVREPHEVELVALPEAVTIPLGQLDARIGELDPDAFTVVYCHLGVRSATALTRLEALDSRGCAISPAGSTPGRGPSTRLCGDTEAMHRIAVEDYAAIIRELLEPLRNRPDEPVPIALAAGRVTAGEVVSPIDLPIFRNSQMDGYAVHAADLRELPVLLPVVGEIAAGGRDPAPLPVGSAVAIMTGAPVPRGADAVVPIEDTRMVDGSVEIARGRDAGDYVREPGSDIAAGAVLLPAGLRLASRHLAALAAANLIDVAVRSRVRVADRQHRQRARPTRDARSTNGRLPDANGIALAAAASAVGADVIDVQLAGDDPVRLATVFDRAIAAGAELIITSGGISMGAHEPVRQLLEPLGATVGTVDMQPGGPQAYARYPRRARRLLPRKPGQQPAELRTLRRPGAARTRRAAAGDARGDAPRRARCESIAGRRQFLRARLTGDGRVETVAGPGSHLVAGARRGRRADRRARRRRPRCRRAPRSIPLTYELAQPPG